MRYAVADQDWDVIVVGTGMGGATLGYALAQAGKRVLFCERGRAQWGDTALRGCYPETCLDPPVVPGAQHRSLLVDAGRDWRELEDWSRSPPRTHRPFIGAGTGGSSALYGMALERFFPEDFTPRANHPAARDASLPETWPMSYQDLEPFYVEAEALYRVRGEPDSLRGPEFRPAYTKPPTMTVPARELFDYLQAQGCHPYHIPLACEFKANCECCQGYLCPRECKNDSSRVCLRPALEQYGASLLEECEVVRLEATAERVTGVVCSYGGETITLRGSVVVLAAGALYTPGILLRSQSESWPDGLANHSGLVGQNLMRHFVDLYVVRPKARDGLDGRLKELAWNDFYLSGGDKLGSVQSFGALPPAAHLAEALEHDLRQGPFPLAGALFRLVKPVARAYLSALLSRCLILASVAEDLPYAENRVSLGGSTGGVKLCYRLRPRERERIERMRSKIQRLLRPYRPVLIRQAENNQRLAHACGTCRFGRDPADSVLDPYNKAHDVANLYVVDGSFFPSSGGINPALTIAANALRVARRIVSET